MSRPLTDEAKEEVAACTRDFSNALIDIAQGLAARGDYQFVQANHIEKAREILYEGRTGKLREFVKAVGTLILGVSIPLYMSVLPSSNPTGDVEGQLVLYLIMTVAGAALSILGFFVR